MAIDIMVLWHITPAVQWSIEKSTYRYWKRHNFADIFTQIITLGLFASVSGMIIFPH